MQIQRLAGHRARAATAALMIAGTATLAAAQAHDEHGGAAAQPRTSSAQQNALVAAVRAATERLKGVTSIDGPGEGYALTLGCGSGGDFGAMGLHYLNGGLVGDGEIDVTQSLR